MNIIFLDVDGVLNSFRKLKLVYEKTNKPHSGYNYPFDEICLKNLKKLVEETNSKIIITSTWRKSELGLNKLLSILKEYDLDKYVIGCTPILETKEKEIKQYLLNIPKPYNFIILDDNSNLNKFLPYLIKTDSYVGLTLKNVEDGIKILNKESIKSKKLER